MAAIGLPDEDVGLDVIKPVEFLLSSFLEIDSKDVVTVAKSGLGCVVGRLIIIFSNLFFAPHKFVK